MNFGSHQLNVPSPIGSVGSINTSIEGLSGVNEAPSAENVRSFGQCLADAIGSVNESQDAAKKATEGLMNGNAESIHEVQIAGAKAEIMMKLTSQVTSKLAQATTQLFQMQV